MKNKLTAHIVCFSLATQTMLLAQQKPVVLFTGLHASGPLASNVTSYNDACFRKISSARMFAYVSQQSLEAYKSKELKPSKSAQSQSHLEEGRKLLSKGKTKFSSADASAIRSAVSDFEEARRIFLQELPNLKSNRDLLDAQLFLGAALVALKKSDAAKSAFEQVVYLNPDFEISASDFSPTAVTVFASAKQSVAGLESSKVTIESTPPGANIYMNAKLVGTTPKKLTLKRGEYFFLIEKKGSVPWYKPITLERSLDFISATLKQSAQNENWSQAFATREGESQSDDALLLSVANGMRADLVFLTSVEDRGTPGLLSQWFDVKSGAFSKVALADLSGKLESLPDACLESIQTLSAQLDDHGNLLNAPKLNYSENDLKIAAKQEQERPEKQVVPGGAWYTKWWLYPLVIGLGVGAYFGVKELGSAKGAKINIDNSGNL